MFPQDIRIIQFKNYRPFQKKPCDSARHVFPSFRYFDLITVSPPDGFSDLMKREEDWPAGSQRDAKSFVEAYRIIQKCFRRASEDYQSQQIMVAFTDVDGEAGQERIRQFWDEMENALFFVTMVNVRLDGDLETAVKRIRQIYDKEGSEGKYCIYYTLDYNEIIIFYKGNTFRDYSKLVMLLNYSKNPGAPNPVMDTITLCGFGRHENYTSEETFDAYLRMDVIDYTKAKEYLDQYIASHNGVPQKRWLLERNDIALWLPHVGLKELYDLYAAYTNLSITTLDLSILIEPDPEVEEALIEKEALSQEDPAAAPAADSSLLLNRLNVLADKIRMLDGELTDVLKLATGAVIIRILYDINALISDIDNAKLAEDLVVVLLPQIEGFVDYINRVCHIIRDESIPIPKKNIPYALQLCWDAFYLNITALINNTVHSDRKFIQIPHYETASFEMPPKIMAYYSLVTHRIKSIFNDLGEDVCCYGIMLSPKLVDELEVEPFALREIGEPHQIISVNISEQMMYQPRRTVAILGHEIAHFVSNDPRCREERLKQILGYYIDSVLQKMFAIYLELLGSGENEGVGETLDRYFTADSRRAFCMEMAGGILEEIKEFPAFPVQNGGNAETEAHRDPPFSMRKVEQELEILPKRIFNNNERREAVFQYFIFPETEDGRPLYFQSVLRRIRMHTGLPDGMLKETAAIPPVVRAQAKRCAETQFLNALEQFPCFWNPGRVLKEFRDNQGYLFSEAYADIAMIVLFAMDAGEYARLFIQGKKDDPIEATRLIAVMRTLKGRPGWDEDSEPVPCGGAGWEGKIAAYTSASLSRNASSLKSILSEERLDAVLISFLVPYLKRCVSGLEALVNREGKRKEVEQLRKAYREVDLDKSAQKSLAAIMKMEAEEIGSL